MERLFCFFRAARREVLALSVFIPSVSDLFSWRVAICFPGCKKAYWRGSRETCFSVFRLRGGLWKVSWPEDAAPGRCLPGMVLSFFFAGVFYDFSPWERKSRE